MRILLAALTLGLTLHAQPAQRSVELTGGFKIGSPLNDRGGQSPYSTSTEGRWTGGPTLELRLPYRFSIVADALYRTRRRQTNVPLNFGSNVSPYLVTGLMESKTWDFPLLLKYRLPRMIGVRPFVSAGYQWSRTSTQDTVFYRCAGLPGSCLPPDYPGPEPRGGFSKYTFVERSAVGGFGVEFKGPRVTIAPEVRVDRRSVTAVVGFTFGRR